MRCMTMLGGERGHSGEGPTYVMGDLLMAASFFCRRYLEKFGGVAAAKEKRE